VRFTLLRFLPAVAGCVLLTSCTLGGVSDSQPVLTVADITGTWMNHHGSTITFTSDSHFSAVAMPISASFPLGPQCDSVTDTGQWDFLSPEGDSPSGSPYGQGNTVGLIFDQNMTCDTDLDTWEVRPPVGLCISFDPDDPCMSAPWTKEPGASSLERARGALPLGERESSRASEVVKG
jgi:hypothetical protein